MLRRRAEIYFDRERRIVYSWRFNLVLATTFDELGIIEDIRGLQLVLCGENAKDDYGWRRILIQPTTQPFFNRVAENKYLLAAIVKFMEHGREAIIIGDSFRRPPTWSLFVDRRPRNFETRLQGILDNLRDTRGGLCDEARASLAATRADC